MATKHPTSHLTLLGDPHSGRDEMNLAGHPFALLQSPKRQSETSIFYEWKRMVGGREVTASWRVETPDAFGLPGPEEELLYLVLLQLTREAAEAAGTPRDWPQEVYFSRRDLLDRLGWGNGAERYKALKMAFNRIRSVTIVAEHTFYDARVKSLAAHAVFGILSEAILHDEPLGRKAQGNIPLSHFLWDKSLHASFLAGNVRSLNLDFAISLDHPTSRRLFRLLDVLRHSTKPPRPQLSIGLDKLRDRLGMTAYKYPSQIAQKLAPAIAELTARGYLDGMEIEKDANGAPMAVFRFHSPIRPPQLPEPPPQAPQSSLTGPQTASAQLALELPDLGMFSPDFDAPSRFDFDEAHAGAVDAFFETLPQDERAEIEARVLDGLPLLLRDNLRSRGARMELARGRRRETLGRYPNAKPAI